MAYTKQELVDLLRVKTVEITFTKVDGTERKMPCTLQENLLPARSFAEGHEERRSPNENTVSAWALDAQGWRSFRVASVINVKELT